MSGLREERKEIIIGDKWGEGHKKKDTLEMTYQTMKIWMIPEKYQTKKEHNEHNNIKNTIAKTISKYDYTTLL